MSVKLKNGMSVDEIDNEISKGYSKTDSDIIIKHLFKENEDKSWNVTNETTLNYNNILSSVEEILELRNFLEKQKYLDEEVEGVKCLR